MNPQGRMRSVWIAMILATAAAIIGLWTLYRENPDASALDLVFWTLQMFTADSLQENMRPEGLPFRIARVLAPLATFIAVIGFGLELMSARFTRWRIRRLRDHWVICGLGDGARELALRARAAGSAVVVVDLAGDASDAAFCATHRIALLHDDPRDPHVLDAAALPFAMRLVVVTGEDKFNLDVASVAGRLLAGTTRRPKPLRTFAAINDGQLWDELSRSDAIRRHSANCEFRAFNPRDLVARRFFWNEPIWRTADLRDLRRVHAVFLGCGAYGQALIVRLLHAAVFRDFERPRVTVLCADAEAELRRLRLHCVDIEDVADISFESFDPDGEALDAARMTLIERKAPVTAIFVCADGDDSALRTAVYVRDAMHRHARWRAPVYVRMGRSERVENLLDADGGSRRFEDALHFFGSDAEHCDLDLIDGDLERLARQMHETSHETRARQVVGDEAPGRQEPLAQWDELRETYREANRRAAGHVKAKLESAGCLAPPGNTFVAPSNLRIGATPAMREALAALEHRSWCLGRRLDGWRPGAVRDNRRRIHDNLVDYGALSESLKEYGRHQIDLIDERLIERIEAPARDAPAVRRDHWIGLIGRNRVSADEARWVRRMLTEQVFPGLLCQHEHAHLTLVTPLAPGLDLVMTEAALHALAIGRHAYRLLVVEGVPESLLLDDYRVAFQEGAAWDGQSREPDEQWIEAGWPEAGGRARIAAARGRILADPACEWLIDLTEPDIDYALEPCRQLGYRAAGDYLARRAHTLVAATHGNAGSRPGGVMETLQRRPAELAAHLAGWPVAEACTTVHLDLDTRRVTVRRATVELQPARSA